MSIGLSILKEVDLTDSGNIAFFAILLSLVIFLFFVFLYVIARFLKFIERLLVFKQAQKKDTNSEIQEESAPKNFSRAKQNIGTMEFAKPMHAQEQAEEAAENVEIDVAKAQREEGAKEIAEGLAGLKSESLKMPSRAEDEEAEKYKKIEAPSPKKFSAEEPEKPAENQGVLAKIAGQFLGKKTGVTSEKYKELERLIAKQGSLPQNLKLTKEEEKAVEEIKLKITKRPAETPSQAAKKAAAVSASRDSSIFGGKEEISRIDLRQKLRLDPKVWQAEKQAGLTLSPVERMKLEKEVFSQALGRSISKNDLRVSIRKLGQKLIDAKDPAEHAKIRKEIKFFKKIGGIQ